MSNQAVLGNPKGIRVVIGLLVVVALLLAGVLAVLLTGGHAKLARADNPGDREVSLKVAGVGVKMKAKELGAAMNEVTRKLESGEVAHALLRDPRSPLVQMARAMEHKFFHLHARETLEAAKEAGRGHDPKFEILQAGVLLYEKYRRAKHLFHDKRRYLKVIASCGDNIKREMVYLANTGESLGHLPIYKNRGNVKLIVDGNTPKVRATIISLLRRELARNFTAEELNPRVKTARK